MRRLFKRGQESSPVSGFIITIGLLIIAYLILIPDADREDLIGKTGDSDSVLDDVQEKEDRLVLLSTSPGEVSPYEEDEFVINLNSMHLFQTSSSEIINLVDYVSVSKSLFSSNTQELEFDLEEVDNVEQINLFFFVKEGDGRIYIKLNGNTVFEGAVDAGDVPIRLPETYLRQSNVIEIGLINSGLFGNSYKLTSVYLKEIYNKENKDARRTFRLTSEEKSGLKDADLRYFINCRTLDVDSVLTVLLNGNILFKDDIYCDAGTKTYPLDENRLRTGNNYFDFEIDKGDYSIENVELAVASSTKHYPDYNFDITDKIYRDAKDACNNEDRDDCMDECEGDCRDDCSGRSDYSDCVFDCYVDCDAECSEQICDGGVIIELEFENDDERKKLGITINEEDFYIDTVRDSYKKDISEYINRGTNYIKIVPKNAFEIEYMEIYAEE